MTKECPNCDSRDTEQVYQFEEMDSVRQTRICNNCPTQWDVVYGNPIIENVHIEE